MKGKIKLGNKEAGVFSLRYQECITNTVAPQDAQLVVHHGHSELHSDTGTDVPDMPLPRELKENLH